MSFESLLAAPLSVKRGQAGSGAVGFDVPELLTLRRQAASAKHLSMPTAETFAAFCELVFSAQSPGLHIVYTRWTDVQRVPILFGSRNAF
jgi:hypothetical protein